MKRKNINRLFDNMETLPESLERIDEKTVYQKTGIDYGNIQRSVLEELGLKKSKKRFKNKIFITLAAAVLTMTIISTTAIASMGGLNSVFGEIFSGDVNSEGLYSGSDIQIHTDDENLNVEVIGITGDGNTVFAAISADKKDGTPFADTEYKYAFYSDPEAKNSYSDSDAYPIDCKVDTTYWQKLTSKGYGTSKTVRYFLSEDLKKVKIIIEFNRNEEVSPKGNIMTVKSQCFDVVKPLKKLGNFEFVNDEAIKESEKIEKENNLTSEECGFLYNGKSYDYCLIERKTVELKFDLSVKLNYKTNIKKITLNPTQAKSLIDSDNGNCTMSISSFGIYISSDTALTKNIDKTSSKIITDSKEEYYLNVSGLGESVSNENILSANMTLNYSNKDNPLYESDIVMIDCNKISKIIINGIEVYSKG